MIEHPYIYIYYILYIYKVISIHKYARLVNGTADNAGVWKRKLNGAKLCGRCLGQPTMQAALCIWRAIFHLVI